MLKRAGSVTAVRGDPDHPVSRGALCGKCSTAYNREWRDPGRRLTQPLKRVRPKACADGTTAPHRRCELRARELGPRDHRDRRPSRRDHGLAWLTVHPERALHGDHLLARGHRADALFQSARRHRSHPGHHLQHGWPRRTAIPVRDVASTDSIRERPGMRLASSSGEPTPTLRRRMRMSIGCGRRRAK